jgi:glycine betaine/proline transport system ATP-binding protein
LLRIQAVLQKTIIFITHDFDEAIRLADRVAIMKDGEIIQIGTPEELVIRPATSYVAEFTRDVARAKVMSARRLMEPATAADFANRIDADAKIATFAADIVTANKPFGVIDESGAIVGQIEPRAVIDLLAGREPVA